MLQKKEIGFNFNEISDECKEVAIQHHIKIFGLNDSNRNEIVKWLTNNNQRLLTATGYYKNASITTRP